MKRSTHFQIIWGQSTSEAFCTAVVDFVQRQGAVSGIVKRMEQLGLGAVASSWLASDVHVPIFSEQLHALFGTSAPACVRRTVGLAAARSRSPSLANAAPDIESPRVFTRSNPLRSNVLKQVIDAGPLSDAL